MLDLCGGVVEVTIKAARYSSAISTSDTLSGLPVRVFLTENLQLKRRPYRHLRRTVD